MREIELSGHAPSCPPTPVRWQSISRSVTAFEATGSASAKCGMYSAIGVSIERIPFSASRITANEVIDFEQDPIPLTVFSVKGSPFSLSLSPNEKNSVPSGVTSPSAMPGIW